VVGVGAGACTQISDQPVAGQILKAPPAGPSPNATVLIDATDRGAPVLDVRRYSRFGRQLRGMLKHSLRELAARPALAAAPAHRAGVASRKAALRRRPLRPAPSIWRSGPPAVAPRSGEQLPEHTRGRRGRRNRSHGVERFGLERTCISLS
jgi:hypothetical protein